MAKVEIAGIAGKLGEAVEESSDIGLQAGTAGFVEESLRLLGAAEEGVEFALLLGFLIDAEVEDGVAQADDLLELNSGAKSKAADLHGRSFHNIGALAGVAGSANVGDVVGSDVNGALIGEHGAESNVQCGSEISHGLSIFSRGARWVRGGRWIVVEVRGKSLIRALQGIDGATRALEQKLVLVVEKFYAGLRFVETRDGLGERGGDGRGLRGTLLDGDDLLIELGNFEAELLLLGDASFEAVEIETDDAGAGGGKRFGEGIEERSALFDEVECRDGGGGQGQALSSS